MKKETKEDVQLWSAIGMLIVGVTFAAAGFIVKPIGEIHDSVLLVFAQCLIYAGSALGISVYIKSKFEHLQNKLLDKNKEEENNES